MNISWLSLVMGALLLAFPLYIIYRYDARRMGKYVSSVGWMLMVTVVCGLVMQALTLWNHTAVNILAGICMAVVGAVMSLRTARLKVARLLIPVVAGALASSLVVAVYVLLGVLGVRSPFETRFFVPVMGLLTGCSVGLNGHALHIYYMGLRHHRQLYDYLLGNGSTHREAVAYFVRRSFQAALMPMMRQMSLVGLTTAPVVFFVMVLGGTDIWTAALVQVVFVLMMLNVSLLSLLITLELGRRYSFDSYERLRRVERSSPARPVSGAGADAASSASHAAPLHTDAASQPQES